MESVSNAFDRSGGACRGKEKGDFRIFPTMISRFLPTPTDYPAELIPQLRQNIRYHLLDGSVYVLGMSLVSVQTILPVFIKEIGGGPAAIGSVQVLWTLGLNIPSVFVALSLRRRRMFTSAMVTWGFFHRFMLLVCGIAAALLIRNVSPAVAVPAFLLLIFSIAAFGSVAGLPWFQIYTKTVPVKLRGRLMGIRQLLGSAGGAVGGSIVAVILSAVIFPYNFAVLFFGAFLFTMISFYYLAKIIEQPTVREERAEPPLPLWRETVRVIRANSNFRNYLIADIFLLMTFSVSSFYSVHAIEKFSLPASAAGSFTAVVMITNVAANIVFGITADLYGHKLNLLAYSFCMMMAAAVAVFAPNITIYFFAFVFMACAIQVMAISRLPLIAEMCKEEERPLYVGMTNTLTAPTVFLGIIFGWLVPSIGYESVFLITAVIAGLSIVVLKRYVEEPRTAKKI